MPCQRKRKGKRGLHLTDILIKFYILAEKCVPNKINLLEMLINEHNNPNLVFTNNISLYRKQEILRKTPSRKWGRTLYRVLANNMNVNTTAKAVNIMEHM